MSKDTSAVLPGPRENLDELAEQYTLDCEGRDARQTERLRERLITELLPFARRLAGRYRNSREPDADLEQVARVGLVKAVNRYDPGRGSFTAFAVTTITGELKRHFRDHTWGVHAPRRLRDLAQAMMYEENALIAELGRRPSDAEIAHRCQVTVEEVSDARRTAAAYRPLSLNRPMGEDGHEWGETFGAIDPAVDLVPDLVTLRGLIERLPNRERSILMERFYANRTQSEIGDRFGMSQMHVSRLLSRTIAGLRTALLTDAPPPWPTARRSPAPVGSVPPSPSLTRTVRAVA